METSQRMQEPYPSGVFFASGPGFWEARPVFWLALAAAAACLVLASRMLGWGGLSALLGSLWISRRNWRHRERRRLAPFRARRDASSR